MFGIKKEESAYFLIKFYFYPQLNSTIDFAWIKENLLNHCANEPKYFSLNYAPDRKMSGLQGQMSNIVFGDVEAFDCSDAEGRVVFSLGKAGSAVDVKGFDTIYECFVICPNVFSMDQQISLLENCSDFFNLQYGYVRRLPADYSPASETQVKKGLFSKSVRVHRVQDSWLIDPKDLKLGAVKGIYQVNFWKSNVVSKLLSIGFDFKSTEFASEGIVRFDKKKLVQFQFDNFQYKNFILLE